MYKKRYATAYITKIAILSAMAAVLMFLEFPIPFMPPFLKMDLSEIPVLLAAFSLGPASAVIIELIKNLIHVLTTQTAGIGELANFLVGIAFAVPAGIIYKRFMNRKGAGIALSVGSLSMVLFASVFNYFVLLPLYAAVLNFPIDAVVGLGRSVNGYIVDVKTFIAFGIAPFNLIKGIMVSIIVALVYKKLSPLLHKNSKEELSA
ncbi:riboflavin transporter FmnP [Anaerobacterium chartisolvens]|uniref:Riboflavin transporter n=1 Tax=Anaerobacterium chartisolvens TaxID=1297424 RepID=A0A369B414_9FIRM|nr:ECF transporter S component [Anaerobacterium chartisolvens]RCX16290.1 riboflavin transporter FmnP [Anaerobacterium chartisolvens]